MSHWVGYFLIFFGGVLAASGHGFFSIQLWAGVILAVIGNALSVNNLYSPDQVFEKIGDIRAKQRQDITDVLRSEPYKKKIYLETGDQIGALNTIIRDINNQFKP